MKTLIYFTNLVSICMNTWINTLFYIRLFLVCVISSSIWISSLILCTTSLYALAGPKIGQIKSCILYLVSCIDLYHEYLILFHENMYNRNFTNYIHGLIHIK